jgi:hypothetical protein
MRTPSLAHVVRVFELRSQPKELFLWQGDYFAMSYPTLSDQAAAVAAALVELGVLR